MKKKLDRLKREEGTRRRAAQAQKELEEKARKADMTAPEEPGLENQVQREGALNKTEKIRQAWSEINRDESLPLKSKLEQLISLQGTPAQKKAPSPKPGPEPEPCEPLRILENSYAPDARYGRITVSSGLKLTGDILTCLSKDEAFRELDLSTALFLDLETTGLSGGSGVIPFLVGLGYYQGDHFHVLQYFLGEPGAEERMVAELAEFFSEMDFQSLVTYNGKAFDLPLLETRFIINRQPLVLSGIPHLDFLFPARRLWQHKYESCRLYNLALEVIYTGRTEDIPSAEIPWRYFQYLQTGSYDLVEPIIYHNAEDILSLLGLVISGGQIFASDQETYRPDAMDLFGAGRIMESYGDEERSLEYFEKALEGRLSQGLTLSVKRRLSLKLKKNGDWERAVKLWAEMVDGTSVTRDSLFSFRELAMYFEHRKKDFERARSIAEEGLVASFGVSAAYENDFRYRLERIKEKLKKT